MQHLYILYYFVTLMAGLFSLGILIFYYSICRDRNLLYYLIFSLSFTIVSLFMVIFEYLLVNVNNADLILLFRVMHYSISFLLYFIFNFSMLVFFNSFFDVQNFKIKNIIGFISAFSAFWLYVFFSSIVVKGDMVFFTQKLPRNPGNILFLISLIYVITVGITRFFKISDNRKKYFTRWIIISLIVTIPGIINDYRFVVMVDFKLLPFMYTVFNLLFLFYYAKIYKNAANELPDNDFFKAYNISNREKEVLILLTEGRRYQEIADTLFISLATAKTHINNIYRKTDVKSKYELIKLVKKKNQPIG